VVFYITTIGNYDYGFSYIFHQDGAIEVDVSLFGIMLAKGSSATTAGDHAHDSDPYGHLVGRNILAPNHQHFFCFRLDLDVDGQANSLLELNSQPVPAGPQNPPGNAFMM
jgi:primary-amine oxidase